MHDLALVKINISPLELPLHELAQGLLIELIKRLNTELQKLLLQRYHLLIVVPDTARGAPIAITHSLLDNYLLSRVFLGLESPIDAGLGTAVGLLCRAR